MSENPIPEIACDIMSKTKWFCDNASPNTPKDLKISPEKINIFLYDILFTKYAIGVLNIIITNPWVATI